jgi:electron transport complex protein RnfD/electron transport complex protein RnfC
MATDYVTSPITASGKILYGIFLGIMTGIFRMFGTAAEGVSYAIILGNLLVPLIEKITLPRAFGIPKPVREKHGKEADKA